MKSQYVFFLIIVLIAYIYCETKFVFEFYRDGVKSPKNLDSFHRDVLKEKWHSTDVVTAIGMKQQYLLGKYIGEHYIKKIEFINEVFNSNEIEIYSIDRTTNLLTAYSQMLGMYPTQTGPEIKRISMRGILPSYDLNNSEKIIQEMRYNSLPNKAQVFPVKTFPPENHFVGLTDKYVCSGIRHQTEKNKKHPKVVNFIKFFNGNHSHILQEALRLPDNYFTHFKNVSTFCDALLTGSKDQREFKSIKPYIKSDKLDKNHLYDDCRKFKIMELYDVKLGGDDVHKTIIRTTATRLIKKILEQLNEIVENDMHNKTLPLKMKMFSLDEKDIGAVLAFLKLSLDVNIYYPKFSSSLLIELDKNSHSSKKPNINDYSINIFLNEITLKTIKYTDFVKDINSWLESDSNIDDFCGFNNDNSLYFKIAACCLFVVFLILLVWIYKMFTKLKKQDEIEEVKPVVQEDENQARKNLIKNEENQS